jgi:hypothetical protein
MCSCPLWVKSGSMQRKRAKADSRNGLCLLSLADVCGANRQFRFGPKAEVGDLKG